MRRAALVLCAWIVAGCGHEAVVRVMDGDTVVGRFIDERAYDAYLRGAILEHEGAWEQAEAAYQIAHETDPEGVAPLVRLAAVRCIQGGEQGNRRADEAFAAAVKVEPAYAPLYTERARCALARGETELAENDARRAMWLDPKDADTSVVYARVLQATGRTQLAVRMLAGYVIWRPQAPEVWTELEAIAKREPRALTPWLSLSRPGRKARTAPGKTPSLQELTRLDDAIASRDLQEAHAAAAAISLGSAAVALRAAALGQWAIAQQEAVVVLAADPWNADARAALVSLPDLEQARRALGEASWARVMGRMADPARPCALGALVLADALQRRLGDDAARAFLEGYGEIAAEPPDPLRERLRARVPAAAVGRR